MTNEHALKVLSSWLQVAYQNADGTDESSAELYEALQTVFALINHQKEEIERLNTENNKNFDKWNILEEKTKKRYAELYQEAKSVVQAEAVREFAEKLKEKADIEIFEDCLPSGERYQLEYKMVDIDDIDDLVKEMTNVIS